MVHFEFAYSLVRLILVVSAALGLSRPMPMPTMPLVLPLVVAPLLPPRTKQHLVNTVVVSVLPAAFVALGPVPLPLVLLCSMQSAVLVVPTQLGLVPVLLETQRPLTSGPVGLLLPTRLLPA